MKHLKTAAFAALMVAGPATFFASAPAESQSEELTPRQLRVIWTENPSTEALISWTTTAAGTDHLVHADVTARNGVLADYSTSVAAERNGAYGDETDQPYFHHALLTDLEPDTAYHFVVETDGNASRELYFRTAHDDARSFKILYGGDSRTGREDRQKMNRLIGELQADDDDVLALVHGGDYIDWANTWWQWSNWLDDHELTIAEDGRVLPIVPAKGNHEGRGVVYNDVFGQPGGDDAVNYFTTQLGNVALVNLDTEVSMAGDQREWLERQLETGRDSRWLVVNYHRPAFPAVKSPSGAREHWVPLFEQYDVDLVCESDGHTLKRTPPIRNEQVDFTGVTYVGEGGLGVPQRTPLLDRWYLQAPGMAASAHHVQMIEFTPDLLRYQAVLESGDIGDEVTILPRAERLANALTAAMAMGRSPVHIEIAMTGPFAVESLSEATFEFSPELELDGVHARSVVDDVLRFVNEATEVELDDDASLDRRAATNIITFRAGEDGELDTDDDRAFRTWEELDEISYVGNSALQDLIDHTDAMFGNPRNVITLRVAGLSQGASYQMLISGIRSPTGEPIASGTTVSFTASADSPADAITSGESTEKAACATAPASPTKTSIWLLILVGFWSVGRWNSKNSSASSVPRKRTAGSPSPR